MLALLGLEDPAERDIVRMRLGALLDSALVVSFGEKNGISQHI